MDVMLSITYSCAIDIAISATAGANGAVVENRDCRNPILFEAVMPVAKPRFVFIFQQLFKR